MKTLKYIFSTTQAICPVREKMMRVVRNLAFLFLFMLGFLSWYLQADAVAAG
jgi:hypothetical protein